MDSCNNFEQKLADFLNLMVKGYYFRDREFGDNVLLSSFKLYEDFWIVLSIEEKHKNRILATFVVDGDDFYVDLTFNIGIGIKSGNFDNFNKANFNASKIKIRNFKVSERSDNPNLTLNEFKNIFIKRFEKLLTELKLK